MKFALILSAALLSPLVLQAQPGYRETRVNPFPTELPVYQIYHTNQGVIIDGKADETDWQRAEEIHFLFPWNDTQKEGEQGTLARMLWDQTNLYISYVCADPYLEAQVTDHDGAVYQEDAVEIFATPNPEDISAYFGYEMNIRGTLLDYIAFGGGTEWTENIHRPWQSEGVNIKTTYQGTLDDHSDTDEGWTLEIAIPLANFRHLDGTIPPQDGDLWRLNLNRTKGKKGQFSQWADSRTDNPSFHHAAYFGKAFFTSKKVGAHSD